MKNFWAIGAAAMAAAGCGDFSIGIGGPQVKGSGNLKTESRTVGNFQRIESRGAANCEVKVGTAVGLKITADDNILPLIETKVEKGVLIISTKGSYSTKNPTRAVITVPNLDGFAIHGSGDAKIDGIRGNAFAVAINGSGGVLGRGQTESVTASISGSGDIDFSNVRARKATASIAGSGDIDVHATESLTASIQGSGDIAYRGNPKNVQKSVAGSGNVRPK